jgi:hypothetical protein
MTVDNFRNSAGERSDGRDDKRTVERTESHLLDAYDEKRSVHWCPAPGNQPQAVFLDACDDKRTVGSDQPLLLALHLDGFNRGSSRLRVKVAATDLDRLQIVIELINQRNAGGNVEAYHRLVTHLIQVLHDCAQ